MTDDPFRPAFYRDTTWRVPPAPGHGRKDGGARLTLQAPSEDADAPMTVAIRVGASTVVVTADALTRAAAQLAHEADIIEGWHDAIRARVEAESAVAP